MGIGRTNIGGGQRIKKTVLVDNYMVTVGQTSNNVSKTYTIPENGYYELYCSCNIQSSANGTASSKISYRDTYASILGQERYTNMALEGYGSTVSGTQDSEVVKIIAYVHAGVVITFNGSCTAGSLYGYSDTWSNSNDKRNGYRVTKLIGLDNIKPLKGTWVTVFTPKGWELNEYVPTLEEIQDIAYTSSPLTRTNPSNTTNLRWSKTASANSASMMYLNFPSSVKKVRVYYRAYAQTDVVNVLLSDYNKTTNTYIDTIQTLAGGYISSGGLGGGTFANVVEYEPTETACFRFGATSNQTSWLEIYAIEALI